VGASGSDREAPRSGMVKQLSELLMDLEEDRYARRVVRGYSLKRFGGTNGDAHVRCPYCNGTVRARASRCHYCGNELRTPSPLPAGSSLEGVRGFRIDARRSDDGLGTYEVALGDRVLLSVPVTPESWRQAYAYMVSLQTGLEEVPSEASHVQAIAPPLTDCTVVGGHSHDLVAGGSYALHFSADAIHVYGADGSGAEYAYRDVRSIELTGGSAVKGTSVVGGGFGLEGALEGMLIASVVNRLTRQVKVWTFIWLRPHGSEVIFLDGAHTPEQLRIMLSPVFGRIESGLGLTQDSVSRPSSDLTTQLERLAALRKDGALTEEEFDVAKKKLLGAES
jgi:hypothetical protein